MRSPHRARSNPRRLLAGLVAAALAVTALVACSRGESPEPTLNAFVAGWPAGKLDTVGFVTPESQMVSAGMVVDELKKLSGELPTPAVRVSQKPKVSKDLATAELVVSWPLAKDVVWEYPAPVRLARDKGAWRMVWAPSVVHPQLTSGDVLAVRSTAAARGPILDGTGKPIVEPRPVVVVGVSPKLIKDLPALTAQLTAAFTSIGQSVDMKDLPARVQAAKPDAFIELITLRRPDYDKIRSRIQPLDGTVFREETWQLPPTREFARALLGSVGPVTKEIMDARPGVYRPTDQVGLSGLQRRYDDRLRGTSGVSVMLTRTDAAGKITETGLWQKPPQSGTPVKTTLDPAVQRAADLAVATQAKRSALVAVRVSDGALLAVSNGPDGGGDNVAFTGAVAPGSTFKMVSTIGLLDAGAVSLDQVVACPGSFTVEGRSFTNAGNFALGNVPFRVDFAKSCNTAFASLAPKLGADGLAAAGRSVGLGEPWDLGVDAFSGKVSTGGGGAERAAAAFGQGTTQVSPLAMAGAVAAVARGRWEQPKLLLDPAPAKPAPAGPALKESTVGPLRTMMREAITAGTGTALASVPGAAVHGKTGTAEFDDTDLSKTHAWFIGWQGDIAFAVFIENGGGGSANAVPLAKAFLTNLTR